MLASLERSAGAGALPQAGATCALAGRVACGALVPVATSALPSLLSPGASGPAGAPRALLRLAPAPAAALAEAGRGGGVSVSVADAATWPEEARELKNMAMSARSCCVASGDASQAESVAAMVGVRKRWAGTGGATMVAPRSCVKPGELSNAAMAATDCCCVSGCAPAPHGHTVLRACACTFSSAAPVAMVSPHFRPSVPQMKKHTRIHVSRVQGLLNWLLCQWHRQGPGSVRRSPVCKLATTACTIRARQMQP